MEFNAKNPELIEKIEQWQNDQDLMKEEFSSFISEKLNSKEGLEWYDFLYNNHLLSKTDEGIYGAYGTLLTLLNKEESVKYFLSKYYSLFNEQSDTPFEPLTVATILRDSIDLSKPVDEYSTEEEKQDRINKLIEHKFWSQACASLYKEAKMPEKAFEMLAPHSASMQELEKANFYLFSDLPDQIEHGKELAKEIDCENMYEQKDPSVINAGSTKFYAGYNKDGLLYHFGGEDFRPPEFVKSTKEIPNHKKADFNGKSVVVTPYRGMGDSMILSRFIPVFLEKFPGVKLTIATEKPLIPLYKNIKGLKHVGDYESCAGMFFDYCLGVNHLARYVRDKLVDDNGATPAYEWVSYPKSFDSKWESLIPENSIGINWKSSQRLGGTGTGVRSQEKYLGRDVPYEEFSIIIDSYPDKTFVVLNPDLSEEERADLEFRKNVIIPEISNFGDTAAIINRCSCIVSVDTSISTLSASMHKSTITLAKFWCDYRWMYPHLWWKPGTVKVFKKQKLNDSWVRPLFNAIKELKDY